MRLAIQLTYYITLLFLSTSVNAQNYINPIVNYNFNNNTNIDESGNSELLLRNNTSLITDDERGSVLHFSAIDKSFAVLNKQLLNSDSCTISFFFLWESTNAGNWHQLFEIHNQNSNSNLFFTPQNGWGENQFSLISHSTEYDIYQAISGNPLQKDNWMHLAITFEEKLVKIYLNGNEVSKDYMTVTPSIIQGDSLYFGGNPNRSDNYYISARLDEIKIFDKALAANQILALYQENDIPAPEINTTIWNPVGSVLNLNIDLSDKNQCIENFGSSDGWNTEWIGKYWPLEKKEKLAELLFSAEKDIHGNPLGIGLSSWRFNIGAGTTEQGEASRIHNEQRRTECFLNNDGETYNWNKQEGQRWFLNKAATKYNLHHIIGWQNSPPVLYTKYNLGFREYGASMSTILKTEYFDEFGRFLADVVEHFETENIYFDYISPLNEPQWGWNASSLGGTVSQEGTPWTNQEIFDLVSAIDNEFSNRNITTKLFIAEAGNLSRLYSGSAHADNQLNKFWNSNSGLSLLNKASFANIVSYHSYFTDYNNNLLSTRTTLKETTNGLNSNFRLWQTEYSLLGNGYRESYPSDHKLSEMETALELSKVIMADLNIANTTAWQWWTTFEKGKHGGESRFCLIEAFTNTDKTDGTYHLNKLFYTIGHFSHFVRPGMTRISCSRSDNISGINEYNDLTFSCYVDEEKNKLVIVAANYTSAAKEVHLDILNSSNKKLKNPSLYLTNEYASLKKQNLDLSNENLMVPAYSIITYTANLETGSEVPINQSVPNFNITFSHTSREIISTLEANHTFRKISLYNLSGKLIETKTIKPQQLKVIFSANQLKSGVYMVSGISDYKPICKKIIVFD